MGYENSRRDAKHEWRAPVGWPERVLTAKSEFPPDNPATTFFEQKLRKLLGQDEARCQDKLF